MDRDFTCVRAWGAACPTLAECTLPRTSHPFPQIHTNPLASPDGVKWMRVRDHIWFPDPSRPEGNDWLSRMILSRRFPEVGQLIDTVEQLFQERMSVLGLSADGNPAQTREAFARLRALGNQNRCTENEDTSAGASVLDETDAGDHPAAIEMD